MKTQITGVTANQASILRKRNPLISGARALYDWSASQGDVANSNALDENADVLLYGLFTLRSFVSGNFLKSAAVLNDAVCSGKKVAFFVDDWHLKSIGSIFKMDERAFSSYLKFAQTMLGREPTVHEIADYFTAISAFSNDSIKILVPVLPWLVEETSVIDSLAKELGVSSRRLVAYDPSPLFDQFYFPQSDHQLGAKQRAWVVSSRYDFTKFIDREMLPSWDVIYYGCSKIIGSMSVPNEVDLIDAAYRPNWGVVSHPYPSGLQGQWRNRFMFAHLANSVTYAVGKETLHMNHFYSVGDLERMNYLDLLAIAEDQRREYVSCVDLERSKRAISLAIGGVNG